MKKRLRLITSLAALGCSQILWSLGLGDITVESALNEPLVAKIELLNVAGLSNEELLANLGSANDYRITDVEREFFHTNLVFETRIDGQADPYLSVTSIQPVTEPFLNIVVQARWPQGKLLGVYTLLLDLPVYSGRAETAAVVAPQEVAEPPRQRATAPPAPRTATRTTAPAVRPAAANIGSQYRVVNGDTLWSLAGNVASNTDSTRHQAMLAIKDGNPDAFINGDLNALKAGTLLRMPDQQESRRRSASDAATEYANLQRRSGRALAATPISSSSSNFRDQSSAGSTAGGRLALSSNSALGTGAGNGRSDAVDDQFAGALASENQALKEELDRAEIESTELKERLAALEEQLNVAKALIEIEDNDLAEIQDGLQTATSGEIAEEIIVEETAEDIVDEETATDTAVASPAPPITAAVTAPASMVDRSMGFLPYIGAVVLVLLLVAGLLMKRRKTADDDHLLGEDLESEVEDHEDHEEHDEFGSEDAASDATPQQTASFMVEDEDADDGFESMDELFASDDDDLDIAAELADESATEEPSSESASSETTNNSDALDIDEVDGGDVQNVDLEGALEDLDEFADLDSFFDDDDVEDFDPDGDDLEELYEESAEHKNERPEAQDDFTETMIARASDLPATKLADKAPEQETGLDFESLELPEANDDEDLTDLHDEHSMDFDEEIALPAADQDSSEEPVEEDSANSLEFELDNFDTMLASDTADEADSAPLGNELDFDTENLELPAVDEPDAGEDLHDEEHLMDFDEDIVVPAVDEDDKQPAQDEDLTIKLSEAAGGSDAGDLSGSIETENMDELLSGLDEDFDLGDELIAEYGDDGDVANEDLGEEINTKIELADAYIDMGDVRGAKELIDEILADGDETQKKAAQKLADTIVGLV